MPILIFVLLSALAHASCDPDLRVVGSTIVRSGVTSTEYKMAVDPKKHVGLRVTTRTLRLGDLAGLGLARVSRAARGLNLVGPLADHLDREVRLHELHFSPPSAEELRHRHHTPGRFVRDQFAADFTARAGLLEYVLGQPDDGANVYEFSFTSEILAWRNVMELLDHGPTRFATKTWLADFFRRRGVKGAIMIAGELPAPALLADLPMRPSVGPTVLFFRPARR